MKKSIFLFLLVVLTTLSFVQLHAQEKTYKAHFLLYTKTMYETIQEIHPNDSHDELINRIVSSQLMAETHLKKALMDTDTNFSDQTQWLFFGPHLLNYEEIDKAQTAGDVYGAFTTPNEPLYQALDSLKKVFVLSNINPYIVTRSTSYIKRGKNIMLRSSNNSWYNGYPELFLSMVSPKEGINTLEPLYRDFPEKHPGSEKGWRYGTLGVSSANWVFPVFAHLDSQMVYFEDEQGQTDSVAFPLGDAEHNVLDPERGWQLDNVFDQSGVDLGFQTTPDTLTTQQGKFNRIQIFPGWNDENVGKNLYIGGDRFHIRREVYPDERHIEFVQDNSFAYPQQILGAYAVAINGIPDAFAMDYILVQFVPEITYPSIDESTVPSSVNAGDEFTIRLKGDIDLMTSWRPEFTVSGIEYEIIASDNKSVTIKALSGGQATITLHHRSLLVLEDETTTITVTPPSGIESNISSAIAIHPNPAHDYIEIPEAYGTIAIYSNLGIKVMEINNPNGRIDISQLPAGVYYISINGRFEKFVKI